MAEFKHKKTGEIISVSGFRMILGTDISYVDRSGKHDLSEYDYVEQDGNFEAVRVVANPNDKAGVR